MDRKIAIIALVLFAFCVTGTAFAQPRPRGQSPEELIRRFDNLVRLAENLRNRTMTQPANESVRNALIRDLRRLEDDFHHLTTDIRFAVQGGMVYTPQQDRRVADLERRWENAMGQIQRNVNRW